MRNYFIVILVFSTLSGFSQKTALLDRKFKQPITFSDSVTVEQVRKAYIPVSVADFDTLYANLDYIEQMLSRSQRAKMQSFELRSGRTVIAISRIPMAYADRYRIVMNTQVNDISSVYTISSGEMSNKDVAAHVGKMKKYLKTNKSLFTSPYEIHPKIYNIVVISE